MPDVARVTAPDRFEAVTLLVRSGFGPTVEQLVGFPAASPSGTLLGLRRGGHLAGVVGAVSFGATGWIGALAVTPEHRREGIARELCETAIDWLRDRGAATVLLYATEQGRPLYERLGFAAERPATAWRGVAAVRLPATVRPLRPDDLPAVERLDRETTGEDRGVLVRALLPLRGWAVPGAGRDDDLRGVALSSPYGQAAGILARDRDAGLALLAASAPGPAPGVVLVPDDNDEAAAAVRGWRFTPANAPLRMHLGTPPARRRAQQFGLFNFFWG